MGLLRTPLPFIVTFLVVAALVTVATQRNAEAMVAAIEDAVADAGVLGPVAYVAVFVVGSLLTVPTNFLVIAGGVLFGVVRGTMYITIGTALATPLALSIARHLGRARLESFLGGRLPRVDVLMKNVGFRTFFVLRVTPWMPTNVLQYAYGLTRASPATITIATTLGTIPVALFFTGAVEWIERAGGADHVLWIVALAIIASVVALAPMVRRIHRNHRAKAAVRESADP